MGSTLVILQELSLEMCAPPPCTIPGPPFKVPPKIDSKEVSPSLAA